MQVAKWGNSLAIRLPATVVKALGLSEGDDIAIRIAGAREMEVTRKPDRAELLARLSAFEGRLPADFTFDRDDAGRG
ncbi:MAG: AbrB/MazE/SpoVT family DNA-binding domain-containing protein [Jannaschia helgolandensis]|jgi:antitoxin MazE|uniref:Antitoxin MazE n=1 Tax=Jannaschia helgolandensis TaxID=188906 RepID=A0A1H7T448_9RHOB|nr:AbrB/MazE/SpoVT family DNA-binding domain-containing protein [Jannaschia helgolandensis]SEL79672.1 antitoxin MazE [Jannaschia helgolandensis]|tara:strand:+ start:502 stop:732 length:231 start_codon:yes stop_codon:yes gene_type:complete